jgi:hypothetical protein
MNERERQTPLSRVFGMGLIRGIEILDEEILSRRPEYGSSQVSNSWEDGIDVGLRQARNLLKSEMARLKEIEDGKKTKSK